MKLRERVKVLSMLLDIGKTMSSGILIWTFIKNLFPIDGEHPQAVEGLLIMAVTFLMLCLYYSLELVKLERRLDKEGDI